MANRAHLTILRSGVATWNGWREREPNAIPDLIRANLVGARLAGADLSGARLHGARLRRADLSHADVHGADLNGADLRRANLSGVDLHCVDLRWANLSTADLSNAQLHDADPGVAEPSGVEPMAQWLEASNLIEATRMAELLGHLEPSGVGVCDASMYGADLRGANLNSADLRGARLHGAILPQAAERRGPTLGRAAPLGMDVRGPSEADKSVGAAGCAWLVTSLRQRRDISISLENRSPESLTAVAVMVGIGVSVGVLVDVMLVAGYAFGSTLGSVAGMLMGSVAGLTLLLVCGGKSEAGRRPWLAPGTVAGIALGVLISVFAPLGTDAAWGVGMAIGIVVANWVAYGL